MMALFGSIYVTKSYLIKQNAVMEKFLEFPLEYALEV